MEKLERLLHETNPDAVLVEFKNAEAVHEVVQHYMTLMVLNLFREMMGKKTLKLRFEDTFLAHAYCEDNGKPLYAFDPLCELWWKVVRIVRFLLLMIPRKIGHRPQGEEILKSPFSRPLLRLFLLATSFRERAMANNILKILERHDKVFVLTGNAHLDGLTTRIQKKNKSIKIQSYENL